MFVVFDKRATVLALAELGRRRVGHAFDLWIELEAKGLISGECFQRLCEATKSKDKGLKRMPARVLRPKNPQSEGRVGQSDVDLGRDDIGEVVVRQRGGQAQCRVRRHKVGLRGTSRHVRHCNIATRAPLIRSASTKDTSARWSVASQVPPPV